MPKNPLIFSTILLVGLFACSGTQEEAQRQPEQALPDQAEGETSTPASPTESPPETSVATTVPPSPADRQEKPPSQPAAVEPAPPPEPVTVAVPQGTVLDVRLAEPISTKTNQAGDELAALLDKDVVVNGKVVFPQGTKAYGTFLAVEGSGRVQGRAEMTITLTEIRTRKEVYRIQTGNITIQAEGSEGRDAKVIGGATGVGALVGGIIGGKKGAAVGAAVGGGAGTATVLTTKGKEVELQPEHPFSFSLSREVEAKLP